MTNPSPAPYVSPIAYSERVELLPLVLTSGWASGINAYAVIVMLNLAVYHHSTRAEERHV